MSAPPTNSQSLFSRHAAKPTHIGDWREILTYDLINASTASNARCLGRARPCSHSCNVRVDIRSFKVPSFCEKSFFFRHLYSRSANETAEDRLAFRLVGDRKRQLTRDSLN
jgi:hypothetical protein